MFRSNEEKISLACAILRDNKGTPEHFLRKCREAGIMHGNRDTQDELWEFEEYVLKYAPGSIRSLKESLLAELETKCLEVCRDIYSDREVGLVLEALIRNGDWRTAAAVSKKRETYTDALVQRANKKIREAVDGNQPFESVLFRLALQRVKLAHASAFCYMTDVARKEALLQSRDLALGVDVLDKRTFSYWFNRYLNSHIGLFGYDRSQVAAVMTSRVWYYKYRVGTWAAVADFLVENGVLCNLTDFWETSFAFTHDVTSPAKSFPGASEFIKENKADWKVIGRMVPGFYRAYEETKERLMAKA